MRNDMGVLHWYECAFIDVSVHSVNVNHVCVRSARVCKYDFREGLGEQHECSVQKLLKGYPSWS